MAEADSNDNRLGNHVGRNSQGKGVRKGLIFVLLYGMKKSKHEQ